MPCVQTRRKALSFCCHYIDIVNGKLDFARCRAAPSSKLKFGARCNAAPCPKLEDFILYADGIRVSS